MKNVFLTLAVIAGLSSCATSGSTSTTGSSTLGTITKVAQISSTISEISSILGGLNLTSAQSSIVTNALKNYITKYNSLDATQSNYTSLLNNYKSEALTSIKNGIGESKYGQFISTLKSTSDKAKSTSISEGTLAIINSLIK